MKKQRVGIAHIPGFLASDQNMIGLEQSTKLSSLAIQKTFDFWKFCEESKSDRKKGVDLLDDISSKLVRSIGTFVAQEEIDTLILHGNSLGGKFAMNVASHPELDAKIGGIILNCSAGLEENLLTGDGSIWTLMNTIGLLAHPSKQRAKVKELIAQFVDIPEAKIPETLIDQTLGLIYNKQDPKSGLYKGINRTQLANFMAIGHVFKKQYFMDKIEEQTEKQLTFLNQQEIMGLVIAGLHDSVLPIESSRRQEELLGADFHMMSTGHIPHIEAQEEFIDLVIAWMQKNNMI